MSQEQRQSAGMKKSLYVNKMTVSVMLVGDRKRGRGQQTTNDVFRSG